MTRPRIVDPGATLALSRRTTRRHFLLHPDEARQMEQVYWYCLAYAAKRHGVLVHVLPTPEAVLGSNAYLIVNPVEAGAGALGQGLARREDVARRDWQAGRSRRALLRDLSQHFQQAALPAPGDRVSDGSSRNAAL